MNQMMKELSWRGAVHAGEEWATGGAAKRVEVEERQRLWVGRREVVAGDFDSLEEGSIAPLFKR